MKIAHIDLATRRLLGWYSPEIHDNPPAPNVEVTDEQWEIAISENHNKVNEDGTTESFDFRTEAEVEEHRQNDFRRERDELLDEADILIYKAEDLGEDTTLLRAYRQALRDSTNDWVLPTKPE